MPLGIWHIVAHEAVTLSNLVQPKEATYGDWYNDRLATVTLEMTPRTLSVFFQALLTSFGLGWHMDVLADEFNLTDRKLQRLTKTIKETSVNEVLALALALGPTKFVVGPLAIVVDLVTSGGVLEFYTYLVLAQGKPTSLLGCRRNSLHTKRAQLHRAFVPNESFRATLVLFHTELCIRIICRSGPSSFPARSGRAVAS